MKRHGLERVLAVALTMWAAPAFAAAADKPPTGLTAAAWTTMRAAIDRDRHRVVREGSSYRAVNHAQRLDVDFTSNGVEVKPRETDGTWRWGLHLTGYGYGDDLR
ncbi:MAG TPA: hypothetical protein VGL15_00390, partial [Vicinamibacteria bacterium]